jgi:hypothetical protein
VDPGKFLKRPCSMMEGELDAITGNYVPEREVISRLEDAKYKAGDDHYSFGLYLSLSLLPLGAFLS